MLQHTLITFCHIDVCLDKNDIPKDTFIRFFVTYYTYLALLGELLQVAVAHAHSNN